MIGKYFRTRRSIATGLGLAGASIGQFVMPPIIEYLLETYGLSGTLLIIAALFSHCAISGALFRPIEQYGPAEVPVKVVDVRDKVDKTEEDKVVSDVLSSFSMFFLRGNLSVASDREGHTAKGEITCFLFRQHKIDKLLNSCFFVFF